MESIVFVELVVSNNDQAQASKTVCTDETIVGDEGLIAIVMDDLTNDTQELRGKVQKITIKTSSGKPVTATVETNRFAMSGKEVSSTYWTLLSCTILRGLLRAKP